MDEKSAISSRHKLESVLRETIYGSAPSLRTNVKVRTTKRTSHKLIAWKIVRTEEIIVGIYFHAIEKTQEEEIKRLVGEVVMEIAKGLYRVSVKVEFKEEERW